MKKRTHLVLLHGALGNAGQMEPLAGRLAKTANVHMFDFSGHARNSAKQTLTMDLFVEDLKRYMDSRAIPVAHVFGYSMGGYAGLQYAIHNPGRVAKLMTLGTKFDWSPETAANEVRRLDPDKISEKVPAFAALLESRFGSRWPELCRETADMMKELGNGRAMDLASLSTVCPVQFCIGELDTMAGVEATRRAAAQLGNVSVTVLPAAKHPIESIDVDLLVALISDWL